MMSDLTGDPCRTNRLPVSQLPFVGLEMQEGSYGMGAHTHQGPSSRRDPFPGVGGMGTRMALLPSHVHHGTPADLHDSFHFHKGRRIDPILRVAEKDPALLD